MKNQKRLRVSLLIILVLFFASMTAEVSAKTTISRLALVGYSPDKYGLAGGSDFMLKSSMGTTIVADPYEVANGFQPDIITVTHRHSDHMDFDFYYEYKDQCKTSIYKVEDFTVKNIIVQGIPALHSSSIKSDWQKPDNMIYLYQIDGLRIAHMGDIGQDGLVQEQLDKLGDLDIVFLNVVDISGMAITKSMKILKQIKPKIVIPTHLDKKGFTHLNKTFKRIEYQKASFSVDRTYLDNINNDPVILFLTHKNSSKIENWKNAL